MRKEWGTLENESQRDGKRLRDRSMPRRGHMWTCKVSHGECPRQNAIGRRVSRVYKSKGRGRTINDEAGIPCLQGANQHH